jgi:hypothetical protein
MFQKLNFEFIDFSLTKLFNIFEIVSLNITKQFCASLLIESLQGFERFYLDKTNKLFSLMIE